MPTSAGPAALRKSPAVTVRADTTDRLRRLYLVRFLFAAAWAAVFAGFGGSLDATSATLLVLYPAVDVVATVYDARRTRSTLLYANIAISAAASIGLATASALDTPAVLRTWGVWAIVAGVAQLGVALARRGVVGQWAMILSGGISVLAGAAILGQAGEATSMTVLAGYAGGGALFFLVSAVRLLQQGKRNRLDAVR